LTGALKNETHHRRQDWLVLRTAEKQQVGSLK
jgi:hypothetical protein